MVKRIACLAAGLMIILSSIMLTDTVVLADEEDNMIIGLSGYTATLYLSDWVDEAVVLTNVKPVLESPETLAVASQLEYTGVSTFSGNIYSKTGAELDLNSLAWYLDMNVRFVAAHLADGSYRIIYMVTQ